MRFSVCTDAVWPGLDTPAAIRQSAALGFDAVEFWFWPQRDMNAVKAAADAAGVTVAGFCTKHMILNDPAEREKFLAGLSESIAVARTVGTKVLISQVGADTGAPRDVQRASIIAGLTAAKPLLERAGVTLAIEPLNLLYDHPGYFLASSSEAFDIVKAVNSPCVKVLFDIYHQQITEGNIVNNIRDNIAHIAHFHAAGHPGRHELTDGELDYAYIFKQIDKTGFSGCVGLEYFPTRDAADGLKAVKALAE